MIVADTTPISVFLRIGRQDLLVALFTRLVVPPAVATELDRGAAIVGDWRAALPFEISSPPERRLVSLLLAELDPGEAEAMALAASQPGTLLLIDEQKGRAAARRLQVPVLGSAGIVLLAKQRGLIDAARPVLDLLRSRGGLWLADGLYRDLLARAGEE